MKSEINHPYQNLEKNMKLLLGLLCTLFFITKGHTDEPSIKFEDLLAIEEDIHIHKVVVKGVVQNHKLPFTPKAIKLHIHGTSACGKNYFVHYTNEVLRFYQIGPIGVHIMPACSEIIEYYLAPMDRELANNESKVMSLKIGPSIYWDDNNNIKERYFILSVKITRKTGDFPDGKGHGRYFTYTDIKVEGPVE